MWHANITCHFLKIMLASKVKLNMLFVLELAAISSQFVFLLSYYSSSSRSFSLLTKGKQYVKKKIKSGSVCSQPHHLQNHCSRQLQNWRSRIYYSLLSTTHKTKNNWKDYFGEQTERMRNVYYLSSREAAHFKAQSL